MGFSKCQSQRRLEVRARACVSSRVCVSACLRQRVSACVRARARMFDSAHNTRSHAAQPSVGVGVGACARGVCGV